MEDGKLMIKVIYEDNHLLVVEKPINIPVQADDSGDMDLLTLLKTYLKEKYEKPGNVYLGLVHRLDRPVGGVMVFAKTSKAAARLSEQIRDHLFVKEYMGIMIGEVTPIKGTLLDKLIKDVNTNIVKVSSNGKEAVLDYQLIDYKDDMSLVKIDLKTGRSHQIRVQFASRNHPLYGDQKYNKEARVGQQLALHASRLVITHPVTKEKLEFVSTIPNANPWNRFTFNN